MSYNENCELLTGKRLSYTVKVSPEGAFKDMNNGTLKNWLKYGQIKTRK